MVHPQLLLVTSRNQQQRAVTISLEEVVVHQPGDKTAIATEELHRVSSKALDPDEVHVEVEDRHGGEDDLPLHWPLERQACDRRSSVTVSDSCAVTESN